jgi:hypothetical protein
LYRNHQGPEPLAAAAAFGLGNFDVHAEMTGGFRCGRVL